MCLPTDLLDGAVGKGSDVKGLELLQSVGDGQQTGCRHGLCRDRRPGAQEASVEGREGAR